MNDNKPQTTVRGTPDKQLPALMDGNTVLLPATTLPLPLGGRSTYPGRDGEDDWADYAAEVLIPRWAVECIRDGLVWGQELEEDCDPEDGYFPIEIMKERVEAILRSPGEMDKWKRIVGWGIDVVRHLDLDRANEWHGGLVELLALGDEKFMSWTLRVAFSQKCSRFIAAAYWASWAKAGWAIVDQCFSKREALDDACRDKILRLVAEGSAYWASNEITGKLIVIPNKIPGFHWFFGKKSWMNNDISQMLKCLTELLTPPTERELSMDTIWLLLGSNMAYFHICKEKEADMMQSELHLKTILAQKETQVADAQTRAAESEAELYRAQSREGELHKALEREAEKREWAENRRREAEQTAAVYNALAEERKTEKDEAQRREREQAARAERAEAERDVLDKVVDGKLGEVLHEVKGAQLAAEKAEDAARTEGQATRAQAEEHHGATLKAVKGVVDKNKREWDFVAACVEFHGEIGDAAPRGKIAKAHAKNWLPDARKRYELGNTKSASRWLDRYSEWYYDLGQPGTLEEYRAKRKTKQARK